MFVDFLISCFFLMYFFQFWFWGFWFLGSVFWNNIGRSLGWVFFCDENFVHSLKTANEELFVRVLKLNLRVLVCFVLLKFWNIIHINFISWSNIYQRHCILKENCWILLSFSFFIWISRRALTNMKLVQLPTMIEKKDIENYITEKK